MNHEQFKSSKYRQDLEGVHNTLESLRKNTDAPVDASMADFVKKKYNVGMDAFYQDLGINPSQDTIQNLTSTPDASYRFLVPEIIREALRLGLRKSPIWPDIVASEVTIKQPSVTMPWINMSEAEAKYVGTAESISKGAISYGQKTVKVRKMGRGIKIPYEVVQYVALNVVALFLQDFGIKLNHQIDALMIDILINGEQVSGSESAPVVGVTTANTLTYGDLLRVWVRMARIGKSPKAIIGGEAAALETLNLAEFKNRQSNGPTYNNLNLKTPIPSTTDYYIHGSVPANDQIIVDSAAAIIKYNAQPLLIESDKIVSNQTMETYASLTTGFGILFRDARVVISKDLAFSGASFPSYMDVDALEALTIE